MSELIKIIEAPRDLWQTLPKHINPEVKAEYLRSLINAGFAHLDAASFVSTRLLPQMADSEYVLEYLDAPEEVEIIGYVANAAGAQRAVDSGRVRTIAFHYSISPMFLERNQRQTPEDALEEIEKIGEIAYRGGQDTVAYIAMAFGNPFGEPWDIDEVVSAVDLMVDSGVAQVTLVDTAAVASPELIRDVMRLVLDVHDGLEVGLHLHTTPSLAAAKITAAYEAGCRRFDSVMAGAGALPYVTDRRVENLSTETLIATLQSLGAELPEIEPLDRLVASTREMLKRYSAPVQ
jgi:hydroxymethylglutaryl-CoA lyase